MAFKDDVKSDQDVFFSDDELATEIAYTNNKSEPLTLLAIFNETDNSIISNAGDETNDFSATVCISRNINFLPIIGDRFVRIEDNTLWRVESILSVDEISYTLICKRKLARKIKG